MTDGKHQLELELYYLRSRVAELEASLPQTSNALPTASFLPDWRNFFCQIARLQSVQDQTLRGLRELSLPLSAISNYADAIGRLSTQMPDAKPDELGLLLHQLTEQVSRAGALIKSLRERVRYTAPQKRYTELATLLATFLQNQEPEFRLLHVTTSLLIHKSPPEVFLDPEQLLLVLDALSRNACEAMVNQPMDQRRLIFTLDQTDPGDIVVICLDSGPGVPKEHTSSVFLPLFTTKPDRLGLGLTISRSIIEMHGGELWLVTEQQFGAEFRFTLPRDIVKNR